MSKRTGFTLVEILIVVIILGILAAIVVPQFTDASNEARVSSLQSDLQTVRSQIELYKMQHNGNDPSDNSTDSATFWAQLTTMTDADGAAGGGLGPYLQQAPGNPFQDSSSVSVGAIGDADTTNDGWNFDPATGKFQALGADGGGEDLTAM